MCNSWIFLSSITFLNTIDILVSEISKFNNSSLLVLIKSIINFIKSKFLIIPFPIIETLETSFFIILFTVFSSITSEIKVPFSSLKVDFVIIGILNFSPISTHLL